MIHTVNSVVRFRPAISVLAAADSEVMTSYNSHFPKTRSDIIHLVAGDFDSP